MDSDLHAEDSSAETVGIRRVIRELGRILQGGSSVDWQGSRRWCREVLAPLTESPESQRLMEMFEGAPYVVGGDAHTHRPEGYSSHLGIFPAACGYKNLLFQSVKRQCANSFSNTSLTLCPKTLRAFSPLALSHPLRTPASAAPSHPQTSNLKPQTSNLKPQTDRPRAARRPSARAGRLPCALSRPQLLGPLP
jgi:hypothetical protein